MAHPGRDIAIGVDTSQMLDAVLLVFTYPDHNHLVTNRTYRHKAILHKFGIM